MTMSSRALQWKSRNNRNPNFYLSKKDRRRMERYFGNAYRGDPGVPHADADRFVNIWVGSAAFGVLTFFDPYMWQLSNQFRYTFFLHLFSLILPFSYFEDKALFSKVYVFCSPFPSFPSR